jgi:hypothetical protein
MPSRTWDYYNTLVSRATTSGDLQIIYTRNETDGYSSSNTGRVRSVYTINVKLFPILGKSRFGNNDIIFDFDKASSPAAGPRKLTQFLGFSRVGRSPPSSEYNKNKLTEIYRK